MATMVFKKKKKSLDAHTVLFVVAAFAVAGIATALVADGALRADISPWGQPGTVDQNSYVPSPDTPPIPSFDGMYPSPPEAMPPIPPAEADSAAMQQAQDYVQQLQQQNQQLQMEVDRLTQENAQLSTHPSPPTGAGCAAPLAGSIDSCGASGRQDCPNGGMCASFPEKQVHWWWPSWLGGGVVPMHCGCQ